MKKNTVAWIISFIAIGVVTVILLGAKQIGIELPDTSIRICGIIEMIALITFVFATVRKLKCKQ